MAGDAEPRFNGAYYGGPVGRTPNSASHKLPRPRRSHGSSCCCCLLRFVITFIFVIGVAALVIWLVLRPSTPKVYVETVSVPKFNVTGNGLNSSIALMMSIRNGNKKIGIYYDVLQFSAYYGGSEMIGYTQVEGFYQGHKNTSTVGAVLTSDPSLVLPSTVSNSLSSDKSKGVVEVEVTMRSRIRMKVGKIKSRRFTMKAKCHLSLPLNNTAGAFQGTKCKVHYHR